MGPGFSGSPGPEQDRMVRTLLREPLGEPSAMGIAPPDGAPSETEKR